MAQRSYGVIFDMDGVLVDSFAAHLESWRRLAAELRQSLTDDQIGSTFGRTSRDIIQLLFGVQDAPTIHRLDHRKEELYRGLIRGRVPVMPGAVEFVKDCRVAGMRLAVGSSGPAENVRLVCDEMGVTDQFSALVTGDDITRGKPDPEVFFIAARRLGLESQQCVVIEDAPVGIEAARRAGMKCIGLVGAYPRESLASASLVAESLGELNSQRVAGLLDG